jgi:hypothetical protein
MTRYDTTTPELWRLPMRDKLQSTLSVVPPASGYVVPPAVAVWLVPRLELHGIRVTDLPRSTPDRIRVWRARDVTLADASFEGRVQAVFKGDWAAEPVAIADGARFVPVAQPKARLVMALLEPEAPDSLAGWGYFASAFEKKEYMEPYVAERVAREMLDADPALREEFEKRLRDDAAFAASPEQRLEFFYRRHPSWDTQYRLYPILRLE